MREGENVTVVGMDGEGDLKSRATQVTSIDPVMLPLSRTMQFRDSNLEAAQLLNPPMDFDGVLVDQEGAVRALWSSFAIESGREPVQDFRGVSIELVAEMIERVRNQQPLHTLDVELALQPLTAARRLGLSDAWIQKLEQHNPESRRALGVTRLTGGSAAATAAAAGRPVAGHRWSHGHAVSATWSAPLSTRHR